MDQMKPDDLLYREQPHETTLAHIKIVENRKVKDFFKGSKESYGVYFNKVFVGRIERYRGSVKWNIVCPKCRQKQARTPQAAVAAIVEAHLGDLFTAEE